jgi:hypothetical protein
MEEIVFMVFIVIFYVFSSKSYQEKAATTQDMHQIFITETSCCTKTSYRMNQLIGIQNRSMIPSGFSSSLNFRLEIDVNK